MHNAGSVGLSFEILPFVLIRASLSMRPAARLRSHGIDRVYAIAEEIFI
jgi:hypothetical protein